MIGYRIPIPGYRLNKAGELVPDMRRLSVSQRLRQAGTKRVRAARLMSGAQKTASTVQVPRPSCWRGVRRGFVREWKCIGFPSAGQDDLCAVPYQT